MEREIKFRIFDPAQKIFIDPSKFSFNGDFSQKLFNGDLKLAKESHSEKCLISQFTGFLDKKGNEIFEGDIVKFHHSTSKFLVSFTAWVVFENGCFGLYWEREKLNTVARIWEPLYKIDLRFLKVIGNQFDARKTTPTA